VGGASESSTFKSGSWIESSTTLVLTASEAALAGSVHTVAVPAALGIRLPSSGVTRNLAALKPSASDYPPQASPLPSRLLSTGVTRNLAALKIETDTFAGPVTPTAIAIETDMAAGPVTPSAIALIETDTAAGPVTPTAIAVSPAIGALSNMSIVFEPRKASVFLEPSGVAE
ncbi:hypothetical protein T484DRAFT_1787292, partial [Baffinella frigidus]